MFCPTAPLHRGLLHAQAGNCGVSEEVQRPPEAEGQITTTTSNSTSDSRNCSENLSVLWRKSHSTQLMSGKSFKSLITQHHYCHISRVKGGSVLKRKHQLQQQEFIRFIHQKNYQHVEGIKMSSVRTRPGV